MVKKENVLSVLAGGVVLASLFLGEAKSVKNEDDILAERQRDSLVGAVAELNPHVDDLKVQRKFYDGSLDARISDDLVEEVGKVYGIQRDSALAFAKSHMEFYGFLRQNVAKNVTVDDIFSSAFVDGSSRYATNLANARENMFGGGTANELVDLANAYAIRGYKGGGIGESVHCGGYRARKDVSLFLAGLSNWKGSEDNLALGSFLDSKLGRGGHERAMNLLRMADKNGNKYITVRESVGVVRQVLSRD